MNTPEADGSTALLRGRWLGVDYESGTRVDLRPARRRTSPTTTARRRSARRRASAISSWCARCSTQAPIRFAQPGRPDRPDAGRDHRLARHRKAADQQARASVNAVENFRGQTALMRAAAGNYPEMVDLLLAHKADVKIRGKYDDWPRQMTSEPRAQYRQTGGLTALLYATRSGCLPVRGVARKGGRGRQSAEPRRHHTAHQRDRHAAATTWRCSCSTRVRTRARGT